MELKSNRICVLYSYAYLKGNKPLQEKLLELSSKGLINLLVDSGAFTAYKSGNPISLVEYIEACKRFDGKVWQYVMLDVIDKKEETRKNFHEMIESGLNPMGVITTNESVNLVNEYTELNEYIGVPGGTRTKGDFIKQRFQQVHSLAKGKVKIHGLGYVSYPEMYQLPLTTVDSSTWATGQMFGKVCWFEPSKGFVLHEAKDMRKSKAAEIPMPLRRLWESYELSPNERMDPSLYSGRCSFNNFSTVNAYIDMAKFSLTKSLNYFFVCTDYGWLALLSCILLSRKKFGCVKFRFVEHRLTTLLNNYKKNKDMAGIEEGLECY